MKQNTKPQQGVPSSKDNAQSWNERIRVPENGLLRNLRTVLQGISLACLAGFSLSALGDTTNVISLTTFESDARPSYTFGYHFAYPSTPPGSVESVNSSYYDPNDSGLTNAMLQFSFDDSVFHDLITYTNASGFGVGFGGGAFWNYDSAQFISSNRQDYIYSFDARVEGLLPGTNTANGEIQMRFDAPDGTVGPTDGQGDTVMQVNIGFTASSNWTHYVFTLDQGGLGGGSEENLALYRSAINNLNFSCNWFMPSDRFGFDADNAVYMDNIKLDVIQRAPAAPPPPTVEFSIADWNFDNKPVDYGYSYTYSQTGDPNFTAGYQIAATNFGVGGSNAWILQFTNASFVTNVQQYAGAGTGCGGPFNKTLFNTTNLSLYKLYFDARVQGLDPAKTSTSATMQFAIRTNGQAVLQKNFDLTINSNYQTFSYTLDKGSIGGGSLASFNQNLGVIDALQPNFQINSAGADYGTDSDNTVAIDNVRLVRLVVGLPTLTIIKSGSSAILSWGVPSTGSAKLQSAPSLNGPWTDVTPAPPNPTNPISVADAPKFFRTQWVPPP